MKNNLREQPLGSWLPTSAYIVFWSILAILCFPLHFRNKVCAGNVKTLPLDSAVPGLRCKPAGPVLLLCKHCTNVFGILFGKQKKRVKWVIKFLPVNIYREIYIFQPHIARHSFSIRIVRVSFSAGAAAPGSGPKCSSSKHSAWSIWSTAVL